jgi:uncharacterized protein YbjT (DUF2867 family)
MARKSKAARKKKKTVPRKKSRVAKKKPAAGRKKKAVAKPATKTAKRATVKPAAPGKKLIVVTGATGAQGGGLVRALLNDPKKTFAVRAVTRNPQSPKALELKRLGAEVVTGDIDDLQSLKKAFQGAYGAYCVTNFWEHMSPEKELAQARNLAEAAKTCKLQHVIWSTLEDTRNWIPVSDTRMPTLMGRYKVPHFDAKGEANRHFIERKVPTTFLLTSFYWENFIHFGMGPQPGADGVLSITLPMGDRKLPGIAREDIGRCAFGVFLKGKDYIGKTVGIAGEHLSGDEMAAALGKALGKVVRYNDIAPEVYRGFGFPGADDLGNMFQFNRDFSREFCAARKLDESRSLNPALQVFAEWLMENRNSIPA